MSSPGKTLFTFPIPPCGSQPAGSITVSLAAPRVYLLTFTIPPDNRLTTASCTAFLDALDLIEYHPSLEPGVVITTSGIPKFYSNGLDLEHALSDANFLPKKLYKLFHRLLTYPMPTVALINGHAFAGGLMLAMHHDYRVMNPNKGFACVNELEFGVPLKPAMSSIFRLKLPPVTYRDLVLEAKRFGGAAAVQAGIVDSVGGLEEVLKLIEQRKLVGKGDSGIYGLLKAEMYRESVGLLSEEGWKAGDEKERRLIEEEAKKKEEGEKTVQRLTKEFKLKL
ncbi:uncharacterized protein CTHT_0007130 [Thermochaetoides thermophila DSM 1495]|uniref:Enoyl-CoA hydratase-like protein n=1 Tax=Chaetomium thermophilum (strain DSM 1495 / CBS 144.50 / IMI 039719) TaxID=759272 RepID=G0RYL6_CHATD|nr:hypothetical protein CTHT_0007130 [Thermochaetoides thermophila DSM 1495]EGS24002.1 hypothetical protein CTHT_0007130 [Thermochaetoides thermophila DSM 1495]